MEENKSGITDGIDLGDPSECNQQSFNDAVDTARILLAIAEGDSARFERASREQWGGFRRSVLWAIRGDDASGAVGARTSVDDIDVFWAFLARLAAANNSMRSQQILEVAASAASVHHWAQRFLLASGERLAVWTLPLASRPRSVEAAESTAASLVMHSCSLHEAEAWLGTSPEQFFDSVWQKCKENDADGKFLLHEVERAPPVAPPPQELAKQEPRARQIETETDTTRITTATPTTSEDVRPACVKQCDTACSTPSVPLLSKAREHLEPLVSDACSLQARQNFQPLVSDSCSLQDTQDYSEMPSLGASLQKQELPKADSEDAKPFSGGGKLDLQLAEIISSASDCRLSDVEPAMGKGECNEKTISRSDSAQDETCGDSAERIRVPFSSLFSSDITARLKRGHARMAASSQYIASFGETVIDEPMRKRPTAPEACTLPLPRWLSTADARFSDVQAQELGSQRSARCQVDHHTMTRPSISQSRVVGRRLSRKTKAPQPGMNDDECTVVFATVGRSVGEAINERQFATSSRSPRGNNLNRSADACAGLMDLSESQDGALFTHCFLPGTASDTTCKGTTEAGVGDLPTDRGNARPKSQPSGGCAARVTRAERDDVQRLARPFATNGHTLRPLQQGQRVAVVGDGWGGDAGPYGGYEAMVTEADYLTYTIISLGGPMAWKETHVLKSCCVILADSAEPLPKVEPRANVDLQCEYGELRGRKRTSCQGIDVEGSSSSSRARHV